jgi:multiple sugar transport system substrate-binding protein
MVDFVAVIFQNKGVIMRKIAIFLISIMVALSLFGCGGNAHKSKLTMWVMPNSQEPVNDVMSILKPFLAKNPDIEIEVVALDWGSAWQKITTAATSKDSPDIVQLGSTWVGSIQSMGAMQDLSASVNAIGGKGQFVPSAWASAGIIGSDEVIAIPWIVDTRALFYRTDVFKKLGLTANDISTWDKFEKTLVKIKKANLVIDNKTVEPLGITGKNDWNVIHNIAPWMWAAGGDFLNKDQSKCALNSPACAKGLNFYINLVRTGLVPIKCLEQNSYQISTDFNNGFYAMYFDGPYTLKALTTPPERGGSAGSLVAKNFAVAPYPTGPKGKATFCGGSDLAIFKASKNKDKAWRVVQYLTTDEKAQVAYAQITGFLPAKQSAFKNPYFNNDPFRKVFTESVKFSHAYPCIAAWGPIETVVLTRRFGLMWDDVAKDAQGFSEKKIKEHLELAAKEVNVLLQKK